MVRLEQQTKRFIGKSTDAKPTVGSYFNNVLLTATDLPAGSTFLEEDVFLADGSQRISRWNGEAWTYPMRSDVSQPALAGAIEALRLEIVALRLGMIEAGTCNLVSSDDAAKLAAA